MRSSGNGLPEVCVMNLIRTFRGEVPYSRLKGLNARNIDRPSSIARPDVQADVSWVIGTYEPRVDAEDAAITALEAVQGDFNIGVHVSENQS